MIDSVILSGEISGVQLALLRIVIWFGGIILSIALVRSSLALVISIPGTQKALRANRTGQRIYDRIKNPRNRSPGTTPEGASDVKQISATNDLSSEVDSADAIETIDSDSTDADFEVEELGRTPTITEKAKNVARNADHKIDNNVNNWNEIKRSGRDKISEVRERMSPNGYYTSGAANVANKVGSLSVRGGQAYWSTIKQPTMRQRFDESLRIARESPIGKSDKNDSKTTTARSLGSDTTGSDTTSMEDQSSLTDDERKGTHNGQDSDNNAQNRDDKDNSRGRTTQDDKRKRSEESTNDNNREENNQQTNQHRTSVSLPSDKHQEHHSDSTQEPTGDKTEAFNEDFGRLSDDLASNSPPPDKSTADHSSSSSESEGNNNIHEQPPTDSVADPSEPDKSPFGASDTDSSNTADQTDQNVVTEDEKAGGNSGIHEGSSEEIEEVSFKEKRMEEIQDVEYPSDEEGDLIGNGVSGSDPYTSALNDVMVTGEEVLQDYPEYAGKLEREGYDPEEFAEAYTDIADELTKSLGRDRDQDNLDSIAGTKQAVDLRQAFPSPDSGHPEIDTDELSTGEAVEEVVDNDLDVDTVTLDREDYRDKVNDSYFYTKPTKAISDVSASSDVSDKAEKLAKTVHAKRISEGLQQTLDRESFEPYRKTTTF